MRSALSAFAFVIMVLVFCAPRADAQTSRIYFAGYMGLNTFTESDFSESTTATSGDLEFKNAFSMAGALGLRLTPTWRVEGEISRRSSNVDRMDIKGGGTFDMGGELTTWLYMLNAYYDFDFEWKNFQPFLTAGLGFASHEASISDSTGTLPNAGDDSIGFAWQLGGGARYRVRPDLAFSGNYRYLGTTDIETDSYDIDYTTHEWRVGMEYDLPVDWFSSVFQ